MSGTLARVLTAVVLIPLVVWLVLWGPTWLIGGTVAFVTLVALFEFFSVCKAAGFAGYSKWTMFSAVLICGFQTAIRPTNPEAAFGSYASILIGEGSWRIELPLFIFLVGCAFLASFSGQRVVKALEHTAVSCGGVLLIALPFSYLIRLHGLYGSGPRWVLFVLVVVWAGDTAAFFVGRLFGKHLLAPSVSPKKTWEGAAANVLASLGAAYVFQRWLPASMIHVLICSVLISVCGQAGDLLESALKRSAQVKDSGSLLPGHGGIWDRIDALILAAPATWAYLTFVLR